MSSEKQLIEAMVKAVEDGYTPESVYETSLTYHPGSKIRVNKATTGKKWPDGGDVAIPKGAVVSVVGVGGGPSGKDTLCRMDNGDQAYIPFYDLYEDTLQKDEDLFGSNKDNEDEPGTDEVDDAPDENDDPDEGDDPDEDGGGLDLDAEASDNDAPPGDSEFSDPALDDASDDAEDGDACYVRVEMLKPISQEALDFLKSGYKEMDGVDLPDHPQEDDQDAVSFLMKTKDRDSLESVIGQLKGMAPESIGKIEPVSKDEWAS